MNTKAVLTLGILCVVHAALSAVSPESKIIVSPAGSNLTWGQIHSTSVSFNWAWPVNATEALLEIYANGKSKPILSVKFSDTTVTSYTWTMGVPSNDMVYDVKMSFDDGDVQEAQLYANVGSFGGVRLNGWNAQGEAEVMKGGVLPYRAAWGEDLGGDATLAIGTDVILEQPYSSGYLCLKTKCRGRVLAALDFEAEPSSPAFSTYLNIIGYGLSVIVR